MSGKGEAIIDACAPNSQRRSGVEAQYYSSVRDDEEDYGLVGCTFALGLRH